MASISAWRSYGARTYSWTRISSSGFVRPALMSFIASAQDGRPSRLRVGFDLTIPRTIEIDFGQASEELRFVSLRQLLNRFDDFTHRAHDGK
jgi:hypothetical protein